MAWLPPPEPPSSAQELLTRATSLSGHTLSEVAGRYGWRVPEDFRRHKGWAGQLIELALGARAGSRAEPDFPHLGVELKTIPVSEQGQPYESTFVCTAPLEGLESSWTSSWVCKKLGQVLWVPVIGRGSPGDRLLGGAFLWSPSEEESQQLKEDWEQLVALIEEGRLDELSARRGRVMQLRPKAANASETSWVLDSEATWVQEQPRAFYLRASFTKQILRGALRIG